MQHIDLQGLFNGLLSRTGFVPGFLSILRGLESGREVPEVATEETAKGQQRSLGLSNKSENDGTIKNGKMKPGFFTV